MKTIAFRLEKVLIVTVVALAALVIGPAAEATDPRPQDQAQLQAAPHGAQDAVCGARPTVLTALDGKYAEHPVSMGLASNGTVVEILSSESGSWTIIMTAPNGVSCLLAAGDYWQDIPAPVAGLAL